MEETSVKLAIVKLCSRTSFSQAFRITPHPYLAYILSEAPPNHRTTDGSIGKDRVTERPEFRKLHDSEIVSSACNML